MRWEYAIFDALVALPPLVLGRQLAAWSSGPRRAALRATLVAALPFVLWDLAVVGRHWQFNPAFVLGPSVGGLPLEEWGFFLAVPLACLLLWETVLASPDARPVPHTGFVYPAALALLVPAAFAAAAGREYTAAVLVALPCACLVDHALGTRVLQQRRGWAYLGAVALLTTAFNGYLTARPIVTYDPRYHLGWHIGTIPIEDYGFGLALIILATALYQHGLGRVHARSWAASLIRARFGGYRHVLVADDPSRPAHVQGNPRVAVIGGGLAGLGAAELLSRRGFSVSLFERDHQLGGKLAAWRERLADGFDAPIEHGFHAFFRHYYNLNTWLDELGLSSRLKPIDDYAILGADGRRFGFARATTAPGLNLLALARSGMFRLRDVMHPRTGRALETLLRYDADREDPRADHVSFAEFADAARLPAELRMVFTTFARAFFADEHRISMAELTKAFHFYYLGHDHGLLYDWLDGGYDEALIDPIAALLRGRGVEIRMDTPVGAITQLGEAGLGIDGEPFDHVVLAADVAAARKIVMGSPALADTELARGLAKMHAGQRYAVMRVWCAGRFGEHLPLFVVTERRGALDAMAFVHRSNSDAGGWARTHHGSVIELHCYAMPDELADVEVARSMLTDAERILPGLSGAIRHRHLRVRADFTALHVGMRADRPGVRTDVPGLVLAGDWVRLPCPAMLMEAANTSARLAVNAICDAYGVRGEPVWTVPRTGLLPARTPVAAVPASVRA
ncbi:MAG: lycopene cyclase domain-containing protein [Deltaproteobacteria bacterium]|nr:lycopene cyclase domain-containing protein [Nannocystaceae bacterium]